MMTAAKTTQRPSKLCYGYHRSRENGSSTSWCVLYYSVFDVPSTGLSQSLLVVHFRSPGSVSRLCL